MLVYNALINTFSAVVGVLAAIVRPKHPRKFFRFVAGRKGLIKHIRDTYKRDDRPVVWIHSASFGEYSVARPIINELRRRGVQVVVTFFSPSGYEAVNGKGDVDYCYYLPIDTKANAKAFLDIIKPDKAVFIVSEYWYNFLTELHRRDIDTYLVSARLHAGSVFYKWYGMMHRKCLDVYKHIFVIDEESRKRLAQLGYTNVSIPGNPLFDNAIEKANEPWHNELIERFVAPGNVFIVGSIHDEHDLRMVTDLANNHPDTRFLMVPHETDEKSIRAITNALHGKTLVYSQCDADTDVSDAQALVIDFVGALAYIYRYAQWAYVGGGFTRYLHSLIEATVYGLPVSFGPETHRKVTPTQISELGIGAIVRDSAELDKWYSSLKSNPQEMRRISQKAHEYVSRNAGSTDKIINLILS